jgi:hypothetical protein
MRKVIAIGWLLLLVAAACAGEEGGGPTGGAPPEVGSAAPDFTLPTAEGGTISLADYRGRRPVLLYFSMGPG